MEEVWKPIEGYNGLYEISSYGRVKSLKLGSWKIMSTPNNSCGYPTAKLQGPDKRRAFTVHRLVAIHFIPNPKNLPQINHIDGNKENNHVENLEWCTASENIKHAYDHGLKEETRRVAAITAKARHRAFVEGHIRKSSKRIEVTEIATGKKMVFSSANEAARALGVYQGNLSAVCRGKIRYTQRYTARYL